MKPGWLADHLQATCGYHEYYPVSPADREYLQELIRKGFPNSALSPELHFIASTKRRCEFLESNREQHLVLDWELISTIGQMDSLAGIPGEQSDLATMLICSLFGDEFGRSMNFRNYHYISRRLHSDAQHLRDLAFESRRGLLFSRATVFALLHELAHPILRREPKDYAPLGKFVDAAVSKFLEQTQNIYTNPEILTPWIKLSGVKDEKTLREGLQRDLPKYIGIFDNNEDLKEELRCDLAAIFAYINSECGINLFTGSELPSSFLHLKKAGDCMMIGAKALKGLQTVKSIATIVENIEAGYTGQTLKAPLIMATARSNILVFLASTLLSQWAEGTDDERAANLPKIWLNQMEKFLELFGARVLDPIESIENFFSEQELLEEEILKFGRATGQSFSNTFLDKQEADKIRFLDLPLAKPL